MNRSTSKTQQHELSVDNLRTDGADDSRMRYLVLGCHIVLFVWLFRDIVFLPNSFAFRDAAHFYFSLFSFVQAEWESGRIPLWNPHDNAGTPLLASATSSVFYPGKLVFFLPIPYAIAFKIYTLGHLLLAAVTSYCLARRWGMTVSAAGLASLCYAYCGDVLFQCYNVVFLCGAAWLPAAICAGQKMLQRRSLRWSVVLGIVLSLMVLAGDPQTACEAGLLIAFYASFAGGKNDATATLPAEGKHEVSASSRSSTGFRLRENRLVLLVTAAVVAVGLAAIQILPTLEFSRLSTRAVLIVPRSIYDIPHYLMNDIEPLLRSDTGLSPRWFDAFVGNPPPQMSHQIKNYAFSLAPWRFAELLWPNCSGQLFQVNHRWSGVFGRELGVWVPSHYMGLVPLLLAMSAMTFRRGPARNRWLSWTVVIALLGSMGIYAPAMLIKWMLGSGGDSVPVGDEVGGVYWLMTVVLPGFSSFRFPAKLMVVAAFGLCMLAAVKWNQLERSRTFPQGRLLMAAFLISIVALGGLLLFSSSWEEAVSRLEPDSHYGPIDPNGAFRDVAVSLLHTAVVAAVTFVVLRRSLATNGARHSVLATALLVITTLDLAIAGRPMIIAVPTSEWFREPKLSEGIRDDFARRRAGESRSAAPIRFFRLHDWNNSLWSESRSNSRQLQWLRFSRDTLYSKLHLVTDLESIVSPGTLELYDYGLFMTTVPRDGREFVRPRRALDLWGTAYFIISSELTPGDELLTTVGLHREWLEPQWTPVRRQGVPMGKPLPQLDLDFPDEFGDAIVVYNESHFPRTWIVRDLRVIAPIQRGDMRAISAVLQPLLFPIDDWIDARKTAVVEDAELLSQSTNGQLTLEQGHSEEESTTVVHHSSQRVELSVVLKSPGLVILSDIFYPGWKASVSTNGSPWLPQKILRTNRIMRGMLLPAGEHRVRFDYRPASFYTGATVSSVSWLALLIGLVVFRPERPASDATARRPRKQD